MKNGKMQKRQKIERAEREVLREREAADFLNVSTAYLRMSRHRGDSDAPPWTVVGVKSIRYLRSDLDAYLQSRRQGA